MTYSEIISYPRPWNREKHPFVAHVEIDSAHWNDFQRLIEDQTQTSILGHDLADDDNQIIAHVGCTTEAIRDGVEKRWA